MIAIGSDHAGYNLKEEIIEQLKNMGYDILDIGCNGEACDYPDIASEVAGCVAGGKCERGILICGTGVGMSMAANKVNGIRAVSYTHLLKDLWEDILSTILRTRAPETL